MKYPIAIEPAVLDETVERINFSLPKPILKRLDDQARATGETRSGYIAHMALSH